MHLHKNNLSSCSATQFPTAMDSNAEKDLIRQAMLLRQAHASFEGASSVSLSESNQEQLETSPQKKNSDPHSKSPMDRDPRLAVRTPYRNQPIYLAKNDMSLYSPNGIVPPANKWFHTPRIPGVIRIFQNQKAVVNRKDQITIELENLGSKAFTIRYNLRLEAVRCAERLAPFKCSLSGAAAFYLAHVEAFRKSCPRTTSTQSPEARTKNETWITSRAA